MFSINIQPLELDPCECEARGCTVAATLAVGEADTPSFLAVCDGHTAQQYAIELGIIPDPAEVKA